MKADELKDFLDFKAEQYEKPEFLQSDPIINSAAIRFNMFIRMTQVLFKSVFISEIGEKASYEGSYKQIAHKY